MPGLSLARLQDYRTRLRRRICLLTSPMPPGDPHECRCEAEGLRQVLRGTQAEFDELQREVSLTRQLREIRHQSWRPRR